MVSRHKYYGLIVTAMLLLTGCDRRPEGVLSDDEMVALMTDMELGEAYAQQNYSGASGDEKSRELGDGILAAHGVTREQLDKTLDWYGHNMEKYDKLYARIEKNIEKKRRQLTNQSNQTESHQQREENDLWPYSRNRIISSLSDNRAMVFSIDKPKLEKGDIVEWRMRFTTNSGGTGILGADYEDGTTTYVSHLHQGSRDFNMRLQLDSAKKIKRLFGVINSDGQSRSLWIDSISLRRQSLNEDLYQTIRTQKVLDKPSKRKLTSSVEVIEQREESGYESGVMSSGGGRSNTHETLRSISPQKLIGGEGAADKSLHKRKK